MRLRHHLSCTAAFICEVCNFFCCFVSFYMVIRTRRYFLHFILYIFLFVIRINLDETKTIVSVASVLVVFGLIVMCCEMLFLSGVFVTLPRSQLVV